MPVKDLQWPFKGVVRRGGLRTEFGNRQDTYPSPWAVNVRVEDNLTRRMRGGSRSGLTKYVATDFGSAITDMVSIDVSRTSGASTILAVLVDSTIKLVEGGSVSSGGSASGFLVTGQQYVYGITTAGITRVDPKLGTVTTLAATEGTIPTDCTFGAVYRDRICLAGDDNAIHMSRQGVYTDWDYGQHVGDEGRALAFQLSLGADVGPLPTAMIPNRDTHLIVSSGRTLWLVTGDPTTGQLTRISETVGIIGSKAWCRVDESIVFLSEDGLYSMQADGSNLTPMSPETIPAELLDVDTSTTTVSIGYEKDREAFHIYLRTAGGSDTHWLYEVGAQAFWPMRLQDTHSPRAVVKHAGQLLLAGNDGYIRYVGGTNDDGSAIQSHVAIGPIRLGQPGYFGRMPMMHAMLAAGGGAVNWRLVPGDTAEEAADNVKLAIEAFQSGSSYAAYVAYSGNWISGRAIMQYPRIRAVWVCLWLQSTNRWAFEGVTLRSEVSGTWRGSSAGVVSDGNVSPSSSPSSSPSPTPSTSVSSSPSSSPSPSASPSSSRSTSPSSSVSSSQSASPSTSTSPSSSKSSSPSVSVSSSKSTSPSGTISASPSASASPSSSRSSSPSASSTPSASRSSSSSASPSSSVSSSPSASASSTPSTSPSSSRSSSPSTSASSSASGTPSSSPSTSASGTPSSTPSTSPSAT